MRYDLNVPYSEKDDAKRRGARWDGVRKTWYIENVESISQFQRWLPDRLKHLTRSSAKFSNAHVAEYRRRHRVPQPETKLVGHTNKDMHIPPQPEGKAPWED